MDIDKWNDLHKKWVKARDSAKPQVPVGAVKEVSMGDAIDAVCKAAKKDYPALQKAATGAHGDQGRRHRHAAQGAGRHRGRP